MQQEAAARQDFEDALKIEPGSFAIGRSLADLLHKMGYVKLAIGHYQKLCEARPYDQRVLLALAHCYQEQAQNKLATELVDKLLAVRPDSVEGLVERGRLALRAKEPQAAERWLRQALERRPQDADANLVLKLALQAQQKVDLDLDRQIDENATRQAELKVQLGRQSQEPEVLTGVGRWMMRTGVDDEVVGWLYTALKKDPNYSAAHESLSEFFNAHDQTRRAAWHAQQANVKLEPQARLPNSSQLTKRDVAQLLAIEPNASATDSEAASEDVQRLCAVCHAYPDPASMPRAAWRKEVKQGYDFLRNSFLAGDFPAFESVVAYYESKAPISLPKIEQSVTSAKPPVAFEKRGTGYMPRLPPSPGVTNANLAKLSGTNKQELLLCETRQDALMVLKPYDAGPGGIIIPQVPSPCHTTVCDLDLDGRDDILVASIGSFFPTDDRLGKVMWLHGKPGGQFDAVELLGGLGRVTDIQVADFNGDKKLDLVVAVYGWRSTGAILYLENQTSDWSQPKFVQHVVDPRHGAIHVPVVDLNRDGRPDFIGLVSQESESVVAFLNQGNDKFEPFTIFSAPYTKLWL